MSESEQELNLEDYKKSLDAAESYLYAVQNSVDVGYDEADPVYITEKAFSILKNAQNPNYTTRQKASCVRDLVELLTSDWVQEVKVRYPSVGDEAKMARKHIKQALQIIQTVDSVGR